MIPQNIFAARFGQQPMQPPQQLQQLPMQMQQAPRPAPPVQMPMQAPPMNFGMLPNRTASPLPPMGQPMQYPRPQAPVQQQVPPEMLNALRMRMMQR